MSNDTAGNDFSAMTKAQLLIRMGAAGERADRYKNAYDQIANSPEAAAPKAVAEADTLAACVRAFDAMLKAAESGASASRGYDQGYYNTPMPHRVGSTAAERVLRHLADKYNVDMVDREILPCQRGHIDTLSQQALMNALSVATS